MATPKNLLLSSPRNSTQALTALIATSAQRAAIVNHELEPMHPSIYVEKLQTVNQIPISTGWIWRFSTIHQIAHRSRKHTRQAARSEFRFANKAPRRHFIVYVYTHQKHTQDLLYTTLHSDFRSSSSRSAHIMSSHSYIMIARCASCLCTYHARRCFWQSLVRAHHVVLVGRPKCDVASRVYTFFVQRIHLDGYMDVLSVYSE